MRTEPLLPRLILVCFAATLAAGAATAQELPQPTEHHKLLQREVGEWSVESTYWMTPDAPPTKSTGTETNKMFGQFWLLSEYEGEFAGAPFAGRGQVGYEPTSGKYVMTWVDTMAPVLFVARGDYDAKAKELTLIGECHDMMTGQPKQYKVVTSYQDADHKSFVMYEADPDSDDWRKSMEMRYARKK